MKTNTLGEVRVCSSRSNFKPYLLALIILPLFSLASHSDTLKQSLQNAYNNSDELMLERMSVKEADESVAKAVAAKRFNLSASQSISSGYNYSSTCRGFCSSNSIGTSISASMSVLDGGRADINIAIATSALKAERVGLIGTEQDVLLSAVTAYMNMRRSLEFVALEQNSVKLLTKEVQAAQDRFEVGEITKTDISFAESRLEAAKG
ncbi:MAG: TolC family protein, partial [Paracoccaceae bacterium]|nr:TolC family protein [Paracoccaceae bacterium]